MFKSLSQAVRLVAILNLAYFGVEFAVALHIGSVSLFADSIDFLEEELLETSLEALLAEKALMRHPTCERYKMRLTTLYSLSRDIGSTLDALRAQAPRTAAGSRLH